MEKCQISLIKPLKTELCNFVVVIVFVVVVVAAVVVIVGVFRTTTSEADETIQLIKFTHLKNKTKQKHNIKFDKST